MYEHGAGDSIGILKRRLGLIGTKIMRKSGFPLDSELIGIFNTVKKIAEEQ
jgi:hypothetical protein